MMDNYEERRGEYGYPQQAQPVNAPNFNAFTGVAKIKVIGVGGAGNNAVNRLIESGLKSAEYIVVNTDNQDLARSKAPNRLQIGTELTKGLGAGADPNIGKAAAEADKDLIQKALKDTDLLFITAGMGGGTGTGAAPVIAKIAKEMKILTVAVVTLPFAFEARLRMTNALTGIEELKKSVDSIITIPNDKISQVVPKGTPFPEALKVADEVLRQGIRGIAELIVKPSLINLDFADVRTTLKGRGLAHMGIGVAKGEKRIYDAVRCAVCSPLLNTTIEGANSVILNVIGGKSLSLDEVVTAANLVRDVIDYSANVIFGACIDENMTDEVEIVIIATGFNNNQNGLGMESQNAALRQASILSKNLDYSYNSRMRKIRLLAITVLKRTIRTHSLPSSTFSPNSLCNTCSLGSMRSLNIRNLNTRNPLNMRRSTAISRMQVNSPVMRLSLRRICSTRNPRVRLNPTIPSPSSPCRRIP